MDYKLEKASELDISKLIDYKLKTIFEYAKNLKKDEIDKINKYVKEEVPKHIDDYKIIRVNENVVGCFLIIKYKDGVLLDEIYIEESYRNKKIGSNIIKNVLANNTVYLWVYKDNINAYNLYCNLGFEILEETENRYFMIYKHN